MAPHTPSLAELLPMHEASMADAHDRARELAATIATPTAA
jgi:FMN-dependent NADH-azoreductase